MTPHSTLLNVVGVDTECLMPAPVRLVAYADIPEPGHGINSVIGGGRDARQLSGGASQGIEARGWNELLERARG